jgi:hypothetical protein
MTTTDDMSDACPKIILEVLFWVFRRENNVQATEKWEG